jgi:hypothetical protein
MSAKLIGIEGRTVKIELTIELRDANINRLPNNTIIEKK